MPSIIPSHLYAFAALSIIGMFLVLSFNSYATTLRNIPEIEQLQNIIRYVATEANELLTLVTTTNSMGSTAKKFIQLPSRIGNKEYWIRCCNDSSQAWFEGSLGKLREGKTAHKVFLPRKVLAEGTFVGGYGFFILECRMNGSIPKISVKSSSGGY